jgi:hypothetical protein
MAGTRSMFQGQINSKPVGSSSMPISKRKANAPKKKKKSK